MKELMKHMERAIEVLYEIGVSKEVVLNILRDELCDNANKYAGNLDAIDEMFQEKLTIDQYIALKNYKIFE